MVAPSGLRQGSPELVPALLLGRPPVDRRYSGLGVGTALVAHVLATAAELNTKAACKAVVVVALRDEARSWWERFGFQPFDPLDPGCLDLYLSTDDIAKTLEQGGGSVASPGGRVPVSRQMSRRDNTHSQIMEAICSPYL